MPLYQRIIKHIDKKQTKYHPVIYKLEINKYAQLKKVNDTLYSF